METLAMLSQSFGYIVALILFMTFTCWMSSEDLADLIAIDLPYVAASPCFQPASAVRTVEASSVQRVAFQPTTQARALLAYSEAFDLAAQSPAYLAAWESANHPDDDQVIDDLARLLLSLPSGAPSDALCESRAPTN